MLVMKYFQNPKENVLNFILLYQFTHISLFISCILLSFEIFIPVPHFSSLMYIKIFIIPSFPDFFQLLCLFLVKPNMANNCYHSEPLTTPPHVPIHSTLFLSTCPCTFLLKNSAFTLLVISTKWTLTASRRFLFHFLHFLKK